MCEWTRENIVKLIDRSNECKMVDTKLMKTSI